MRRPLALGLADVGAALEPLGVVHVDVGGGDVEVAGDGERLPGERAGALGHGVEERELGVVHRVVERAAVDHVDAGDTHAADGGLDPARLLGQRVARQVRRDVLERAIGGGEDGDAGPLPRRVLGGVVAGGGELVVGEGVGGDLRLLQADGVGRVNLKELEQARQARPHRVHVPGR